MKDLSNNNVIHVKSNGIEYLQFKKLLQYPNIQHAYAIKPQNYKAAKVGIAEEKSDVLLDNYKKLCETLGVDFNKLVKPNQEHTNNVQCVYNVEKTDLGENYLKTDGLITNKKEVVLTTSNADCILLLFYDPVKNVIANVHSGWKGTSEKIAEVTVNKLKSEMNCNPKDIICCMCPSIRKCHFQVEEPVKDIFEDNFKYTNRINEIIEYRGKRLNGNGELVDKWLIDTILINKILLEDCGLLKENIIDSEICSVCNCDEIHSCRVEGKEKYGLNTAIMQLK